MGIAAATVTGHDVAWAETSPSDAGPQSNDGPGASDPGHRIHLGPLARAVKNLQTHPAAGAASPGADAATPDAAASQANVDAPQQNSPGDAQGPIVRAFGLTRSGHTVGAPTSRSRLAPRPVGTVTRTPSIIAAPPGITPAEDATAQSIDKADAPVAKFAAAVGPTTSITTTPEPPGPLSPIEKLKAAPGQFVNVVLQVLDITVSSTGPKSPLNFAPIDEALFAGFRRVEDVLGLDEPPAVQPELSHETYILPVDAPQTPTVEQFLNAATAEYVLGGTPAGLKPFTVDGKQMTSRNVLTGEAGKAWVTPEGQIIIAYQGTTGGTNLLFHPFIAISQIVTDTQIIFTDTTPQAFTDSLTFANQVRAEAAKQGYSDSDIFVTGHSLGGWEAEYVAQQTGLGGIGFESPGINTIVDDNGVDSGFVNVETYGDTAAYFSTDLPGLQPFMPPYVPGGGSKPHYGSIVMIGDPEAAYPLQNASALWGTSLVGDAIFAVDILGNFFEHHLPGMQAYNLDVNPDPGVVPWLGSTAGPVNEGWGELTIPELKAAASANHVLITP
jgi:hypothetical protein